MEFKIYENPYPLNVHPNFMKIINNIELYQYHSLTVKFERSEGDVRSKNSGNAFALLYSPFWSSIYNNNNH